MNAPQRGCLTLEILRKARTLAPLDLLPKTPDILKRCPQLRHSDSLTVSRTCSPTQTVGKVPRNTAVTNARVSVNMARKSHMILRVLLITEGCR